MKNSKQIIVSMLFVVGIAFSTHYFFISQMETQNSDSDRGLASFGERNSSGQIKWEQNVAKEISSDLESQNQLQKPTLMGWQDKLVYEFLRGKYNVEIKQGFIEKLTLQDQENGIELNVDQFMKTYGSQLKNYKQYELKKVDALNENIELYDQSGQAAGLISITKDDQGRVVTITIQ